MLQGLVRCSACGATLCQAVNHTSLQCYAYAHGKCKTSHSISIKKINAMLLEAIENAAVTGEFKITARPVVDLQKNKNIPSLISREKKKLERIKDAYENEVYTLEEYKESREQIVKRIQELTDKHQSESHSETSDRRIIRDKLTALLPALRSPATGESQKNALLKSVVERVIFYRSSGGIDVFFYI